MDPKTARGAASGTVKNPSTPNPDSVSDTATDISLNGVVVALDLDGTLVDTAPDLVRALNAALASDGLPAQPLAPLRVMVGRGARALVIRALARLGTAYPESGVDTLRDRFLDAYRADIAAQSRPYPGALDALRTLKAAGADLVMATNKPDALAHALLDALNVGGWFSRVVGADTAPKRKPDGAHLRAAIGAERMARAVMVGDSEADASAARDAGIPVILMRHGYTETPIEHVPAEAYLDGFHELPACVAALMANAPTA